MSNEERGEIEDKLDTLSERIESNVEEYRKSGEPSGEHESFADYLRKKHAEIRRKLAAAAHGGHEWNVLRYEFELDINTLMEQVTKWEDQADARTARSRK